MPVELDAGRAYIYYGGSGMDNTADVILTGAAADDFFGIFSFISRRCKRRRI